MPGQGATPPGAPNPDPHGPKFLTIVVKPGADPVAVGRRIAGPSAAVHQAPQQPQENLPHIILRWTYRVVVAKDHELEALGRAQTDSDVSQAYLGEYPGQYPEA
jgi:hypothetical protein